MPQTVRMRTIRALVILALLSLTAGVALLMTSNQADSYGWFAYAPEGDSVAFDSGYLLSTRQVIGWLAVWVASLILTGVLVRHLVLRSLAPEGDPSA